MFDGVGPIFKFRRDVFKELFENFDERDWLGDVFVENGSAVLQEDRALGRLEDDVVLRVTGGDFLLYFLSEIVGGMSFASQKPCVSRYSSTSAPSTRMGCVLSIAHSGTSFH